jgi:hypothetical protein
MHEAIVSDRGWDTIILIIPSHDCSSPQKRIPDQDLWADAGMRLFSRLYGGATSFTALRGIWRSDDGTDLLDEPILIQSLVRREDADNEEKLEELAVFARRLRRETNQKCVAVICNDTIHYIWT